MLRTRSLATFGESGAPNIDVSYRAFIATLPEGRRSAASWLPCRLGFSPTKPGSWADFLKLDVNRDLPLYLSDVSPAVPWPRHEGAAFLEAHHAGAVFGLVADRIADGQIDADRELLETRRLLLEHWVTTLERAVGSRDTARSSIARALAAWRLGVQTERRARRMRLEDYAIACYRKLHWVGTAARCYLRERRPGSVPTFKLAYALFLQGLQCLDDAADETEDRTNRRSTVAGALGCDASALLRAAPYLVHRAAEVADGAGFAALRAHFGGLFSLIEPWTPLTRSVQAEFEGQIIAAELEETILDLALVTEN